MNEMTLNPRTRALRALARALENHRPSIVLDGAGYTGAWTDNLLDAVLAEDCEADLRQGSGSELATKFRAAHVLGVGGECLRSLPAFPVGPRGAAASWLHGHGLRKEVSERARRHATEP